MKAVSAGILLYRRSAGALEVLLVKPGGPYWRNKDVGSWQIPKGLIEPGEGEEQAARREASEELGTPLAGALQSLGTIRQAGGKTVAAFALEQDFDTALLSSNQFSCEWPPRSGRLQAFPEVEAARWMTLDVAEAAMLPSQRPLLDLLRLLVSPQ